MACCGVKTAKAKRVKAIRVYASRSTPQDAKKKMSAASRKATRIATNKANAKAKGSKGCACKGTSVNGRVDGSINGRVDGAKQTEKKKVIPWLFK